MQWTCQLVVKTGTPPKERVDGPSLGGSNFVSGGSRPPPHGWLDKPLPLHGTAFYEKHQWRKLYKFSSEHGPNVQLNTSETICPDNIFSSKARGYVAYVFYLWKIRSYANAFYFSVRKQE